MADGSFLNSLLASCGIEAAELREFAPAARYFKPIDALIYLNEDCSYRTKVVDENLSLLLHPSEDKVVGIMLNGFSVLAQTSA